MSITSTLLAASGNGSDTNTYVFTVSPEEAGLLVFGFTFYDNGSTGVSDVSSVTTDAGTPDAVASEVATNHETHIYQLVVSSAGDIEITITLNNATFWMEYGAVLMVGADATVHDTASDFTTDFPTTSDITLTLDLDTVDGGAVFGFGGLSINNGPPTALAFTGMSDGFAPYIFVDNYGQAGYADVTTGETPRSVSLLIDSNGAQLYSPSAVAVSYAPLAGATAVVGSGLTTGLKLNRIGLVA